MSDPGLNRAWGTTVFCEDVRPEIGGKITFVGVYSGAMNVHVPFPYVIPKFGFWIRYFEVPGEMKGDAKLFIYLPGDKDASIEADIPLETLRTKVHAPPDPSEPDVQILLQYQMPIMVAPLILKEPGRIRVRMKFEDTIVRLGSLPIIAALPLSGSEDTRTDPTVSEQPASQSPSAS